MPPTLRIFGSLVLRGRWGLCDRHLRQARDGAASRRRGARGGGRGGGGGLLAYCHLEQGGAARQ
eukprot:513738-Prymnesium_polylepis.1